MANDRQANIKIFVSHRIDQNNATVDNPLYVSIRCGSVFDKDENASLPGDDTGDHISHKRMIFNEYTVMYWAWKNADADYYGLCHYRRFLSFSDQRQKEGALNQVFINEFTPYTQSAFGLLDPEQIRQQVTSADIIVAQDYNMIQNCTHDYSTTGVKEIWLKHFSSYLEREHFDFMLELIRNHHPELYDDAVEYMNGNRFRGFNIFVMRKDLFFELCEFMFPILFEFDGAIDRTGFSETQNRAVGYVGEWLYSIWIYHKQKTKAYTIVEKQLVSFADTAKPLPLAPSRPGSIPVVYIACGENRPFIAVSMQSILENAKDSIIDFIVLERGKSVDLWHNTVLANENRCLAALVANYSNATVRFVNPKEVMQYDKILQSEYLIEKDYLAVLPWIIGKGFDKAIYISENMLLQDDIGKLFSLDAHGVYALGSEDRYMAAMRNGYEANLEAYLAKTYLNKRIPERFVSTDILLINMKMIRDEYNLADVIDELKLDFKSCLDSFNYIYADKIGALPKAWNVQYCLSPNYFKFAEYIPAELSQEFTENALGVSLRYFSDFVLIYHSIPGNLFWKYARETVFYEYLLTLSSKGTLVYQLPMSQYALKAQRTKYKFPGTLLPADSARRKVLDQLFPAGSRLRSVLSRIFIAK